MGKILSSRCSVGSRVASPIDQQVLAGDETGVFGAEKRAIRSELRWPAVAFCRIGVRALAPKLLEALAGRRQHPIDMCSLRAAVEDSGQQIVDGDVAGNGLARQPSDETHEAG